MGSVLAWKYEIITGHRYVCVVGMGGPDREDRLTYHVTRVQWAERQEREDRRLFDQLKSYVSQEMKD